MKVVIQRSAVLPISYPFCSPYCPSIASPCIREQVSSYSPFCLASNTQADLSLFLQHPPPCIYSKGTALINMQMVIGSLPWVASPWGCIICELDWVCLHGGMDGWLEILMYGRMDIRAAWRMDIYNLIGLRKKNRLWIYESLKSCREGFYDDIYYSKC